MELRHLRYFKAVAETLNFTRAATRLHVAQPALSRQIADLEYELGVDLLKRTSHGAILTVEGRLFLEAVKDILHRAEEAIKQVRMQARGEWGELHVGYLPPLDLRILPRALAEFQKNQPHVNVVLHDLGTDELCNELREGSLQLALMIEPSEQARAGVEFEEIGRYPFFVAMAAGHPLSGLRRVPLEAVSQQPLVVLGRRRNSEYYRLIQRVFAPRRPNVAVESDSVNSLITEVEIGKAVAVVSQVFKEAVGKRLTYRPLAGTDARFCIGIARARGGTVTAAGEELCATIRRVTGR